MFLLYFYFNHQKAKQYSYNKGFNSVQQIIAQNTHCVLDTLLCTAGD